MTGRSVTVRLSPDLTAALDERVAATAATAPAVIRLALSKELGTTSAPAPSVAPEGATPPNGEPEGGDTALEPSPEDIAAAEEAEAWIKTRAKELGKTMPSSAALRRARAERSD